MAQNRMLGVQEGELGAGVGFFCLASSEQT